MIVTGIARLGRDAEVRYTANGDAVASLALAYNYGKKEGGKQPTQWVDASLWGKRAEALAQYLTKGTLISVVLSDVHVETYQKKDGTEGQSLRARVLEVEFAGGKRDEQPASKPARPAPADDGFDDSSDIPF